MQLNRKKSINIVIRRMYAAAALLFFSAAFQAVCAPRSGETSGKNQEPRHSVSFPAQIAPGDPLFVSLTFTAPYAAFEKAKAQFKKPDGEKILSAADFYPLPDSAGTVYFTALPLSTFLEPGTYELQVVLHSGGAVSTEQFAVTVCKKEFVSETLKLDSRNTTIKTDNSPAREKQIERLYAILNNTDFNSAAPLTPFSLPVTSTRRTSFFGDRRVYEYTNGKSSTELHYGIDFGVPKGTPVQSCANGTVVLAAERITTGFSVVVEHAPGLYSLYYHLDSFSVKEGQRVALGEKIGLSGATGLATGPHLHWEVRLLGTAVNPDYFVSEIR